MKPLLIVGAGPVGTSLALILTQFHIPCRIIDKTTASTSFSKALALHARTLEIFNSFGIVDQVLEKGQKVGKVCFHTHEKEIAKVDYGASIDSLFNFIITLPQPETEKLLANKLKTLDVNIERGSELLSLEQKDEFVTAEIRRSDDSVDCAEFSYIIGCDGAHSTVRHLLGAEYPGKSDQETWIFADIELEAGLDPSELHVILNTKGVFVMFPMRNNRYRIGCNYRAKQFDSEPTEEELREIAKDININGSFFRIQKFDWITHFQINYRQVKHYQYGRVFLAGDAAHIHSPVGGQGMNTGIQDAYNLGWKLAMVIKGQASPELLGSYEKERRPIAKAVLQETEGMTHMGSIHSPFIQKIRNEVISVATRFNVVRHVMMEKMSQLSVSYQDSPISKENWNKFINLSGLSLGDRAPNVELKDNAGNIVSLHQLQKATTFQLLLFTGKKHHDDEALLNFNNYLVDTDLKESIQCYFIFSPTDDDSPLKSHALTLFDENDQCHGKYLAKESTVYLIRPDGYVIYRNQKFDPSKCVKFLTELFSSLRLGNPFKEAKQQDLKKQQKYLFNLSSADQNKDSDDTSYLSKIAQRK